MEDGGIAVVVVPLPAQSHLAQLLHLSALLAARGLPVHYVGSATHLRQATHRAHYATTGIRFHPLPVPPFATPPPASSHFPAHLQPAFDAAHHLETPLAELLRSLSSSARRLVVLHDSLMSFAARAAASLPNAEAYAFHSVSAFASVHFQWESRGRPPEPWAAGLPLHRLSFDGCHTIEFLAFARRQHALATADAGRLLNTCRAIEGEFIDIQAQDPRWRGQRLFAVGPLNPTLDPGTPTRARHACMDWLDKQPLESVVYVSFGTTSTLSCDQIIELAAGLELSRQRFIWVQRDADRGDIYANGGEARAARPTIEVQGLGIVVRDWAPQPEILAHPSTGAFVSHCGWGSCMESMSAGVAMVAWPMHSDQPRNALLVTEVLRAGVAVWDWAERTSVVQAAAVAEAIARVMEGEAGEAVRKRAREVGEAVRRPTREGGTSRADLDAFVAHITR